MILRGVEEILQILPYVYTLKFMSQKNKATGNQPYASKPLISGKS